MKFLGLSLYLIAVAAAAPTILTPHGVTELAVRRSLPALVYEEIHDEFGQYALRYVTVDGTVVSERGWLVPTPDGTSYVMVFEGEVSYIGDGGQTHITKHTAGLEGYKAEVNQLPIAAVPVSIPVTSEVTTAMPSIVPKSVSVVSKPITVVPGPDPIIPEPVSVEPIPDIAVSDKVVPEHVPVETENVPAPAETVQVLNDPVTVLPETEQ